MLNPLKEELTAMKKIKRKKDLVNTKACLKMN